MWTGHTHTFFMGCIKYITFSHVCLTVDTFAYDSKQRHFYAIWKFTHLLVRFLSVIYSETIENTVFVSRFGNVKFQFKKKKKTFFETHANFFRTDFNIFGLIYYLVRFIITILTFKRLISANSSKMEQQSVKFISKLKRWWIDIKINLHRNNKFLLINFPTRKEFHLHWMCKMNRVNFLWSVDLIWKRIESLVWRPHVLSKQLIYILQLKIVFLIVFKTCFLINETHHKNPFRTNDNIQHRN